MDLLGIVGGGNTYPRPRRLKTSNSCSTCPGACSSMCTASCFSFFSFLESRHFHSFHCCFQYNQKDHFRFHFHEKQKTSLPLSLLNCLLKMKSLKLDVSKSLLFPLPIVQKECHFHRLHFQNIAPSVSLCLSYTRTGDRCGASEYMRVL